MEELEAIAAAKDEEGRIERENRNMVQAPAYTAGVLASLAVFLPVASVGLFLVSLAFIFGSFVLAIVSLVKGKIPGGIIVLIVLPIAFFGSAPLQWSGRKFYRKRSGSESRPGGDEGRLRARSRAGARVKI